MKLNSTKLNFLHIGLIIIGTIFISLGVFHENLWFDETYSVGLANHTLSEIWTIGGHDVHPVLYYWLIRPICLIFPNPIIPYRLFSVLGITVLGTLGFTHIRKDFGRKTGLLFSFFAFFMAESANYANEVRMYTWAITFVTLCAIYAYRIYCGDSSVKNWLIFFISSLLSIYIHYYGLMTAGLINLFLLIYLIKTKRTSDVKKIVFFGVIQAIAYLPWMIYFVSQLAHVSKGFWISYEFPGTLFEILFCQLTGNLDRALCAVIIALIYREVFALAKKAKNNGADLFPAKIALAVYCGVIGAALAITFVMHQSIVHYRYMFVITGLLIFAISYVLAASKNTRTAIIICAVVGVLGVSSNAVLLRDNYHTSNGKLFEYLEENVEKDDMIVYSEMASVVTSLKIDNQNQIFYNPEDWGVKEAYLAYAPNMEVVLDKNELDSSRERVWLIDTPECNLYETVYKNNKDYTLVSKKFFDQRYYWLSYSVILLEKI